MAERLGDSRLHTGQFSRARSKQGPRHVTESNTGTGSLLKSEFLSEVSSSKQATRVSDKLWGRKAGKPDSKMASFYQPEQMLPKEILSDHGDSDSVRHRVERQSSSIKKSGIQSTKKPKLTTEVLESRRSSEMLIRRESSTGRRGSSTKSRKSKKRQKN